MRSPALLAVCLLPLGAVPAIGQSLDDEIERLLGFDCVGLGVPGGNDSFPGSLGPNLDAICAVNADSTPGSASGGGAASTQGSGVSIARAHAEERVEEERRAAADPDDPERSSGPSQLFSGMGGLGVWATGDSEKRYRDVTRLEDGYDATTHRGALGADYRFHETFFAGAAFEYAYDDGSFDGGGDFETESYGGLGYASLSPVPEVFVDAFAGYAHQDYEIDRFVIYDEDDDVAGGAVFPPVFGIASSDTDGEEFQVGGTLGYDHTAGSVTIGPRAGVTFVHTELDGYRESGGTGLELVYDERTRQSLQHSLGIHASATGSTSFGVIIPELELEWIHEYQNDGRHYSVRFVEDLRASPTVFSFETDDPDRDFFRLGGGFSVVLQGGVQAFVRARTLLGHDLFDGYGLTAGLRLELGGS